MKSNPSASNDTLAEPLNPCFAPFRSHFLRPHIANKFHKNQSLTSNANGRKPHPPGAPPTPFRLCDRARALNLLKNNPLTRKPPHGAAPS